MSTITRERIAELANFKPSGANSVNSATREEWQELARIALASLEAEPVAWTDADELRDARNGGTGYLFALCGDANKFADPRRQLMLYTAAPAPLVSDEIAVALITAIEKEQDRLFGQDYLMDSKDCIDVIREEMERLNARCAPVLQGNAEPSKMSGIMPDYEGGTLSQRELFQAGWEAHHAAMLQSGAPVQFGWSKGHFGYNALFNAISKAVSIQGSALSISVSAFEDAMLAAAPQREVQ